MTKIITTPKPPMSRFKTTDAFFWHIRELLSQLNDEYSEQNTNLIAQKIFCSVLANRSIVCKRSRLITLFRRKLKELSNHSESSRIALSKYQNTWIANGFIEDYDENADIGDVDEDDT